MLDLLPQLWKGHFSDWLLLKSDGIAHANQSSIIGWSCYPVHPPILYAHSCAVS